MRDVKSFSPDDAVTINTENRVNIFYGLNGTGKSTISQFLNDTLGEKFKSCSYQFEGYKTPEIRVYNQSFIEDVFYEKESFKGIFSLGKGNVEAKRNIERAEGKITAVEEQIEGINEATKDIEEEIKEEYKDIKNRVWQILPKYKDTNLDYCLVGYKRDKDKFFKKVLDTEHLDIECDLESLLAQADEFLNEESEFKQRIKTIDNDFSRVEESGIFDEAIVGTDDSYLSELIRKLGNSDWVNQGRNYLKETNSTCPFCQQEVNQEFKASLDSFFDDIYRKKIKQIKQLERQYSGQIDKLEAKFESDSFQDPYVKEAKELDQLKIKLLNLLRTNLKKIQAKIEEPSKKN